MKKVSYVASMLLVALSTAGALMVGQSYAADNQGACVKGVGVNSIDYSSLTPKQLEELQLKLSGG